MNVLSSRLLLSAMTERLEKLNDEDLLTLAREAKELAERRQEQRDKVVFRLVSMPEGSWVPIARAIRQVTGMGLKQALDILKNLPQVVPIQLEHVDTLETALRSEGCEVEIIRGEKE